MSGRWAGDEDGELWQVEIEHDCFTEGRPLAQGETAPRRTAMPERTEIEAAALEFIGGLVELEHVTAADCAVNAVGKDAREFLAAIDRVRDARGDDEAARRGRWVQPEAFCEQPTCQAKNDGSCHVPENCGHFQPKKRWEAARSPQDEDHTRRDRRSRAATARKRAD